MTTRSEAIALAREALFEPRMIISEYYCEECDQEWTSVWDSACDDECSGCGKDFSPYDWSYVDGDDEGDDE